MELLFVCPNLCIFSISSDAWHSYHSLLRYWVHIFSYGADSWCRQNQLCHQECVVSIQFSFIRHANSNFWLVRVTYGANVALNVVMRDLSTQRSHFAFSVELLLISSHSQSLEFCWRKRHVRVSRKWDRDHLNYSTNGSDHCSGCMVNWWP